MITGTKLKMLNNNRRLVDKRFWFVSLYSASIKGVQLLMYKFKLFNGIIIQTEAIRFMMGPNDSVHIV